MASLEEEKLVQMVHDFIEPKSPSPTKVLTTSHHQSTYQALQEILGTATDTEINVLKKICSYLKTVRASMKTNSIEKLLVMKLRIDGYEASLCKTEGDYEYIEIGGSVRLIVDIDFKAQFELARPTPTYTELSNSLPSIFVGIEDKLRKIILILCSAAKQSLKERGLHIPPWRRTSYMLTKWLSVSQKVSTIHFNISKQEARSEAHGSSKFSKWVPPPMVVKPKLRNLGGGSGLTTQLSTMSINCC